MPSNKIKQIELNGVTYDIKDPEAVKFGGTGDADEIVVLSNSENEVVASGTTLADLYTRIDAATIIENVEDGEWIINIVNDDGSVDMSNYYSKSKVDELIASVRQDANRQSDWNQADSSSSDYIKNKPSVPTKVSDLPNDAGYITSSAVKYTEICDGVNYTGAQIMSMYNNNVPMCVSGNPVIFAYISGGVGNTVVIYIRKSANPNDTSVSGTYPYYALCYGSVSSNGASRTWNAAITNFVSLGKDIIKNNAAALVSGKAVYEHLVSNYYTKTDVNDLIAAIQNVTIQIVQTLPVSGASNVLYFVPKTGSTNDVYDEYMWISNAWEHVGSTEVDLTGYATQTWVQNQNYITVNGVRYLEVKDPESTYLLDITGQEVYNNFQAGVPMSFGGSPIAEVFTGTQDGSAFVEFWFFNNSDSVKGVRGYRVAPDSKNGSWASVFVDFSKLSGGSVVNGNGSFVTGGQVYTALAGKADAGDIKFKVVNASVNSGGNLQTELSGGEILAFAEAGCGIAILADFGDGLYDYYYATTVGEVGGGGVAFLAMSVGSDTGLTRTMLMSANTSSDPLVSTQINDLSAELVPYDNSSSGLSNDNVQDVIDELASAIDDRIVAPNAPSGGDVLTWDNTNNAWVAQAPVAEIQHDSGGYYIEV